MKLCTDACILGAWSAEWLLKHGTAIHNILDIGTGTGLLSLMLAQRVPGNITALEPHVEACTQAMENVKASPFADRITVKPTRLQDFDAGPAFDIIISNPPFYENDLKSPDSGINAARHEQNLNFTELCEGLQARLSATGLAFILIPYTRGKIFLEQANKNGLFLKEMLNLRQTPSHPYFRSIMIVSPIETPETKVQELSIHDAERKYTGEFVELLKPYYLKL